MTDPGDPSEHISTDSIADDIIHAIHQYLVNHGVFCQIRHVPCAGGYQWVLTTGAGAPRHFTYDCLLRITIDMGNVRVLVVPNPCGVVHIAIADPKLMDIILTLHRQEYALATYAPSTAHVEYGTSTTWGT